MSKCIGRFSVFAVALLVGTLLLGQPAMAAKTIRFAFEGGKTTAYAHALMTFQKEVEKASKGGMKVNIFWGGSLAGGLDAIQMVKMGNCEMYMDVTAPVGNAVFPKITVFDIPYIFKDIDHQIAVLKSPIAAKLFEEMTQSTGIRVLGYLPSHFRAIAATKEIRTPGDMAGFKIRSVQSALDVAIWERLGALPVTLPWGEIYTSLATNMIGGLAAPPASLLSGKFSEVCKYMTLADHQTFIELLIINDKFYQKLSKEEQGILINAMAKTLEDYIENGIKGTKEFPNPLEQAESLGMTLVRPDKAAFEKALGGLEKQFIPKDFSQELYDSIKNFKY